MKTIAQQLNVTKFPFEIKDKNNNEIYHEDSCGFWSKREYDKNHNVIYFEDSSGFWQKREFDENNNEIYYEDSNAYWSKREYDEKGNKIYFENSNGKIVDNRLKLIQEYTMEELTNILGKPFKIVK